MQLQVELARSVHQPTLKIERGRTAKCLPRKTPVFWKAGADVLCAWSYAAALTLPAVGTSEIVFRTCDAMA
jgi:hypothetical protein